jgi:cellulose synthase/poly-beta-1,6-N-acetylglucosamine synthase-like glycosyltransferase
MRTFGSASEGSTPAGVVRARPTRVTRRPAPLLPPEARIFGSLVDPTLLDAAARRANALGVGIDEVLRCHGILSPDLIASTVAEHLGVFLDPLHEDVPAARLDMACKGVFARRGTHGEELVTVAPRGDGIPRLAAALAREPRLAAHLRIASPERLSDHVRYVFRAELSEQAVRGLSKFRPDLSAAKYGRGSAGWLAFAAGMALIAAALVVHDSLQIAIEYLLALLFIAWTVLRLAACAVPDTPERVVRIPDRSLPIYTIIAPLRGEAPVVANLIAALRRIDYPPEKLDIKLVLEEDDFETRAAVTRIGIGAPFEIIAPSRSGPRTKPRALASALLFARGSFVVVFDAEDEPEPDQLRKALAAFADGPPELACVQARLAIDNASDGWLSRHFAAEYAGQFDVFLPALAKLRLPLPLGGTSNHFRADALRRVGGWDPFNVTEDADLGMRLARFGYRTSVIESTTWEEAPIAFGQWLRQRTRWFKGWMQVWGVHMRHPVRLHRELGWRGFAALQLLIGGTVLSALVHPFFFLLVAVHLWTGELFDFDRAGEEQVRKVLALATLFTGYFGATLFGAIGLSRRRMLQHAWVLATVPIYWLLLSLAAWRALRQLVKDPYLWEKTKHGLARSSLRNARSDTRVRQWTAIRPDSNLVLKSGATGARTHANQGHPARRHQDDGPRRHDAFLHGSARADR